MSRTLHLGRRRLEVSHPDKPWFPETGLTKGDVVDYYRRVAEYMRFHLADRPVTLHRWPDGIGGDDFFQQARPDHVPDWVGAATLPRRRGGELTHPVADSTASLLALVDAGCITPHLWLSRADRPEHPDRMVFDLDPPDDSSLDLVRAGALALEELLEACELVPLVMSTGSSGLHVVVPLRRADDFDAVRSFARGLAEILVDRDPERYTLAHRLDQRGGRLYLDVTRNAYGQHVVAPYAVRALPEAPVATPLEWSEVRDPALEIRRWRVDTVFRRLGQRRDPWKGAWRRARQLSRAPRRRKDGSGEP